MPQPSNHPRTAHTLPVYQLTMGALFVALFALAGNVPVLSAIQFIPGVPITLQNFLVVMMGFTLGVRGGLTSLLAVLVLTFCGLPMMSGGRGGPAVFVGPTCGYIYGWVFMILLCGLYARFLMPKLIAWRFKGLSLHLPAAFLVGMTGVLLDYLCGSAALAAIGGKPIWEIPALFVTNIAFLPGDAVKVALAAVVSLAFFVKPALARFFRPAGAR